jgi:hypothetical protein
MIPNHDKNPNQNTNTNKHKKFGEMDHTDYRITKKIGDE